jgi:hypothetical protein
VTARSARRSNHLRMGHPTRAVVLTPPPGQPTPANRLTRAESRARHSGPSSGFRRDWFRFRAVLRAGGCASPVLASWQSPVSHPTDTRATRRFEPVSAGGIDEAGVRLGVASRTPLPAFVD